MFKQYNTAMFVISTIFVGTCVYLFNNFLFFSSMLDQVYSVIRLLALLILFIGYGYIAAKAFGLKADSFLRHAVVSFSISVLYLALAQMPKIRVLPEWHMKPYMHLYYLSYYVVFLGAVIYLVSRIKTKTATIVYAPLAMALALSFIYDFKNDEKVFLLPQFVIIAIMIFCFFNERIRKPVAIATHFIVSKIWHNSRIFLTVIFMLALLSRGFFAFSVSSHDLPAVLEGPDSSQYDMLAWQVSKGFPITKPAYGVFEYRDGAYVWVDMEPKSMQDFKTPRTEKDVMIKEFFSPAYELLMALIYKVFGHNQFLPRLLNSLLAALSVIFTYLIGRKLFSENIGKIAAVLDLGTSWYLCHSVYIAPDILGTLLFQIVVYLFLILGKNNKNPALYSFLGGIACGLLILTRPEFEFFIPFIAAYILFKYHNMKIILPFTLALVLMLLPWVVRNLIAFNEIMITTALHTAANLQHTFGDSVEIKEGIQSFKGIASSIISNFDNFFRFYIERIGKNFMSYFNWRSPLNVVDFINLANETRYNFIISLYLYLFLFIGILKSTRERKGDFIFVFLFFFFTVFAVSHYHYWHLFKILPFLHIFQALGLITFFQYIKKT